MANSLSNAPFQKFWCEVSTCAEAEFCSFGFALKPDSRQYLKHVFSLWTYFFRDVFGANMNTDKIPGNTREEPCLPRADRFIKLDFFKFRGKRLRPDDR
jgi:hypothetical protein